MRIYYYSDAGETASIGVGVMILFVAMVLVAGIAASVLVQTANRLEIQAMTAGQQTTTEVSTGLKITDIEGHYTTRSMAYNTSTGLHWNEGRDGTNHSFKGWHNYTRIHNITMTVTPRAGSKEVDFSHSLLEISNSTTKCILTYDSNNFNATVEDDGIFGTQAFDLDSDKFGIIKLEDSDGSCTSLDPVLNRGDRAMLTINTSACFWGLDRLEDIWGTIAPEEGSLALFSFQVPASLSDAVRDLF